METRLRLVSPGPPVAPSDDQLVAWLVEALRYYRGVGHRSLVIAYVLAAQRKAGIAVTSRAADWIVQAFEGQLGDSPEDQQPFRLPFGAGSHRWALKEALDNV